MDLNDLPEVATRLSAATVAGAVLGINRDLRSKPTGVRTLALLSLGSASIAVAGLHIDGIEGHPDATSRVIQGLIQGVLVGIGFVGAGVVLHGPKPFEIHGLTTAANVWLTAVVGMACGLGAWHVAGIAVLLGLIVLVAMIPVEMALVRMAPAKEEGAKAGRVTQTSRRRPRKIEPPD